MKREDHNTAVLGFAGLSGSGKTTLIEKLIRLFKKNGLKVAVIKHDIHGPDIDREGKDTFRFGEAGADTVMISSEKKSVRIGSVPCTLSDMIKDAGDADIVLVEGYKHADIRKIAVISASTGYETGMDESEYCAVVSDDVSDGLMIHDKPVFDRNDICGIHEWIVRECMGTDKDKSDMELSHFDEEGNARMIDVSDKDITFRTAAAGARVLVNNKTFKLIKDGSIKKGDVLAVAQIAGIMGAKRTPELIPMCHPVITDGVDVKLKLNEEENAIDIEATVRCTGRTGVEMEAICACSVAAMTVYDMCKSVQRDIVLTDIRLLNKSGGIHGDYTCGR